MRDIQTSLIINASRDRVWETLLDKSRWAGFSDLQDLDASLPLDEGRTFRFRMNLLGLIPVSFTVRVVRKVAGEELRWVGKGPGARGEHYFRLSDAGKDQTRLVHGEEWSGPLGELIHLVLQRIIAETFATFNVGLALQVEKGK